MSNNVQSVDQLDFVPHDDVFLSPHDWRDQFIYFLLVDRFDNHKFSTPAYNPDKTHTGREPDEGGLFQGGNLRGITKRLDYIQNLGCTAIWLSPIFKNRQEDDGTYHGYGIQDFLKVDERFGTIEDLRKLVRHAHSRGMYVILDIIINHTGDNWAYPGDYTYDYWNNAPGSFDFGFWRQKDPEADEACEAGFQADDAVWPLEFQNPDSYKRRGQIKDWNNPDEATNGDFMSLKELDIRKSKVLNSLIMAYKYWIGAADIDGFRIDTVKHTEDTATAIFCNSVREYAKRIGKDNFFIFGEIVGDDAALHKYLGRNARIEGTNERFPSLDSCLDFPLYFILDETIKGYLSPTGLRDRYEKFKTNYADHGEASRYFVTFLDNHDQMSRPYRRFMNNNPYPEQAALAMGYLLTSSGVPCIYYGTEQGFDGGGDHDKYVRECMFGGKWGAFDTTGAHFFNPKNQIYRAIQKIANIRANEPALRYGRQYFREISGDGLSFEHPVDTGGHFTLAFSRILDTEEVLVALNLDAAPRQDAINVDINLTPSGSSMIDLLNGGPAIEVEDSNRRAYVRVPLKAHQMAILKRQI